MLIYGRINLATNQWKYPQSMDQSESRFSDAGISIFSSPRLLFPFFNYDVYRNIVSSWTPRNAVPSWLNILAISQPFKARLDGLRRQSWFINYSYLIIHQIVSLEEGKAIEIYVWHLHFRVLYYWPDLAQVWALQCRPANNSCLSGIPIGFSKIFCER